jgi:regulator of sigma E protease
MSELLLNNSFLTSVIAFVIILIPAVVIHEFGHFIAARIVGINVLEFGIGFPPRMKRLFFWGETEFTLNWLPIGGFVRPLGEDLLGPIAPEDDSDKQKAKPTESISERDELISRGVPEDKLMSVNDAKPLGRIFFMAAGAIANVLSALIVFIVAALIGIPQEVGARMQIVEIPAGLIQTEVAAGDAVEKINGQLFRNHVEFFDLLQELQGQDVTLQMRRPDDLTDAELAGKTYEITTQISDTALRPLVLISFVMDGSPASDAGLLAGDRIVQVNGQAISLQEPVQTVMVATEENAGSPMTLQIQRQGEIIDITVTPRLIVPEGQGRIGIGISSQYAVGEIIFQHADSQVELIPQSLPSAVGYGLERTTQIFMLIGSIPQQLLSGTVSPEEARPVSIVGISQIGGQFLQQSIREGSPTMMLEFLGLISIFLGITNLLPLPPLDGGRIVFVLIEVLRGRPVPPRIEYAIHQIGITLLLSLGVIIIIYDIIKPLDLMNM